MRKHGKSIRNLSVNGRFLARQPAYTILPENAKLMQHMHAVAKLEFAPFPEFKTWLQGLGRRRLVLEFRNWQVGSLKEALGKRTFTRNR